MAERVVPEQFVGERIGGRFVIERLIGDGPLSSAFRARDELLQRRVTVKLFHPQHADDAAVVDAQLELAKAVARLSHPNIVTVIDRGEHEGLPFIVLEYVRGENLQERIDRYAPLPIAEVVNYAQSVARALAYAHGQGVAHGNLRPVNVLISEDREVKIVDFGGGSFAHSMTGDAFALPESLRQLTIEAGRRPEVGADIYALGAVAFSALTEQRPETNLDAGHVQMLRPDASPKLASVIGRALSTDESRLYPSMHEFASDLAAVRVGPSDASGIVPVHGNGSAMAAALAGQDTAAFDMLDQLAPTAPPPAGGRAGRGGRGTADGAGTPGWTGQRSERSPRRRQTRSRLLAWSMVLVPLAALVLVAIILTGEAGRDQQKAPKDTRRQVSEAKKLDIVSATSFDPEPGDGVEHDVELPLLTDGDPGTSWETEGYDAQFPAQKPGVGFYLELKQPADLTEITVISDLNGWNGEVYAAERPSEVLAGWTKVSDSLNVIRGQTKFEVDTRKGNEANTTKQYKYYLVWIPKLALDIREGGKHRARVGEVAVKGVT